MRGLPALILLGLALAGCQPAREPAPGPEEARPAVPEERFALREEAMNWSGEVRDRLLALNTAYRVLWEAQGQVLTGNVVWAREEAVPGVLARGGNLAGGGLWHLSLYETYVRGRVQNGFAGAEYLVEGPWNAVTTKVVRARGGAGPDVL